MDTRYRKERCSQVKRDGSRCRAWAMKDSEPPVCGPHGGRGVGAPRGNQNRRTHGLYRQRRRLDDADLVNPEARELSLWPEIMLVKVVNSRLMSPDWEALPATELADLYSCVAAGSNSIGRLLLTEQKIERSGLTSEHESSYLVSKHKIESKHRLYGRHHSVEERAAAAEAFSLIDEIARARLIIRDTMGFWQEREPDVKEMIVLAYGVNRGVNQVRRLMEALLETVDDAAVAQFEDLVRVLEIVREEGIETGDREER